MYVQAGHTYVQVGHTYVRSNNASTDYIFFEIDIRILFLLELCLIPVSYKLTEIFANLKIFCSCFLVIDKCVTAGGCCFDLIFSPLLPGPESVLFYNNLQLMNLVNQYWGDLIWWIMSDFDRLTSTLGQIWNVNTNFNKPEGFELKNSKSCIHYCYRL